MRAIRPLVLISIGGLLYMVIELLFRGRTHWTMFIVGGMCFYFIGLINEIIPWGMPLFWQCLIGAAIVTIMEFVSGCIINLALGWAVWDYSGMPLNILGQVCLPFSIIWCFLSLAAIVTDDFIRYLMGEERPHYIIFGHKK